MLAKTKIPQTIEATIIRADGTIIPLGVISNSKWFKFSPRQLAALYRIKQANRKV